MPRRYEQRTYMEATGRGFLGWIGFFLKWIILGVLVLAILGALAAAM